MCVRGGEGDERTTIRTRDCPCVLHRPFSVTSELGDTVGRVLIAWFNNCELGISNNIANLINAY